MKTTNILSLVTGFLLCLSACVKEELIGYVEMEPTSLQAVKFSSRQSKSAPTKVEGNNFSNGDRIGIFMLTKEEVTEPEERTVFDWHAENRMYLASSSGDFAQASPEHTIYYPESTPVSDLQFIAYYPYKEDLLAHELGSKHTVYRIDVANQETPEEIDFLYAQTGKGLTSYSESVRLHFQHVLSKIVINVRHLDNTYTIDSTRLQAIITNIQSRIDFDLSDSTYKEVTDPPSEPVKLRKMEQLGIKIDASTGKKDTFEVVFQGLIVPQEIGDDGINVDFKNRNDDGSYTDNLFYWTLTKDRVSKLESGKVYTFWLTTTLGAVDFSGITISSMDYPFGNEPPEGDNPLVVAKPGDIHNFVFPNRKDSMFVSYIPASTNLFKMGFSAEGRKGIDGNVPSTPRYVIMPTGYLMGQTPVTNKQFMKFLNSGDIPGTLKNNVFSADVKNLLPDIPGTSSGAVAIYNTSTGGNYKSRLKYDSKTGWSLAHDTCALHPVMNVSWFGAMAYARWAGGNLPTEAQWEYAARAGLAEDVHWIDGTTEDSGKGNLMSAYAWENKSTTRRVGQMKPNNWNLYDLFGNVWEWMRDTVTKGADYPAGGTEDDPLVNPCTNATTGTLVHPIRGANWTTNTNSGKLAIDFRNANYDTKSDYTGDIAGAYYVGFRVVFKTE
jgi:formylglycine-generating enzyme required for sulfatase activity